MTVLGAFISLLVVLSIVILSTTIARRRERRMAATYHQSRELQQLSLLTDIVECSDDAIISETMNGNVVTWNAGAQAVFGYHADEMIGQSVGRLIPPETPNEEAEIIARIFRGERIEHYETVRMRKGGQRINVSLTLSPVRDIGGQI